MELRSVRRLTVLVALAIAVGVAAQPGLSASLARATDAAPDQIAPPIALVGPALAEDPRFGPQDDQDPALVLQGTGCTARPVRVLGALWAPRTAPARTRCVLTFAPKTSPPIEPS